MKHKTPLICAAMLMASTSASATVLFGPAVSGLNKADGSSASTASKTVAIIDVDGDGLAGFNLASWNGSSFLPDASDQIVFGINATGTWNEATGDGDGFEALVPSPQKFSLLDASGTPYEINAVSNASNTPAVVGGGDHVYLFFFPDLAPGASSPGANRAFGVIDLGALPDGFGALVPNLVSASSDYRATFTTLAGSLPGDTNGDGDVDDSDLGTSFANYTGPIGAAGGKTAAEGDTNGDGDVDDSDLGTSFANYTGPISPVSVPEPTSLALLGLGGLCMLRRRRA